MRFTLGFLVLLVGPMLSLGIGHVAAAEMKVTLLGTGTPTSRLSSFSASMLIEAGKERLIFDFGGGSSIRLFQNKVPLGSITAQTFGEAKPKLAVYSHIVFAIVKPVPEEALVARTRTTYQGPRWWGAT
jgi:hypothetical protein